MVRDPGAMHMSDCHYQKDLAFAPGRGPCLSLSLALLLPSLGQKLISHWKLAEVHEPEQPPVTRRTKILADLTVHLPIGQICGPNWLDLLICVKFISSPKARNNLTLDLDGFCQFFFSFMPKVRKTHKKSSPKWLLPLNWSHFNFIHPVKALRSDRNLKIHISFSVNTRDLIMYDLLQEIVSLSRAESRSLS